MNPPLKLYIKKCCLIKIFRKSVINNDDLYAYLFIPYTNELGDLYIAYLEAPKSVLMQYFINPKNEIVELLEFSKLLHFEPAKYISEDRMEEIKGFYSKAKNYSNIFPIKFRNASNDNYSLRELSNNIL